MQTQPLFEEQNFYLVLGILKKASAKESITGKE